MSDIIKQINNIRSLRAQARELHLEVLEEILQKFSMVVSERREEEKSRIANENQRREKMEALRQMMLEDGIDPTELLAAAGSTVKSKKIREPRPPKYEYQDYNGERKTWTGQGRTPKRIAELLEDGAKLEDFELK